MTETQIDSLDDDDRTPSRPVRLVVGAIAGVGATGIAAGLGVAGTFIDIGRPLIDPSPLILLASVVGVAGYAGAVLRGRIAVLAITIGAALAPIGAVFSLDPSCPEVTGWAAVGLVASAIYALIAAGLASFAGDRMGDAGWIAHNRRRGVLILAVLGAIGMIGWAVAVEVAFRCP